MSLSLPFRTPLEKAAAIIFVPCAVGSAGCVAFCIQQMYKKQSYYMGWLLAATTWLLVSMIIMGLRYFTIPNTVPFYATRVSLPMALSKLCYSMGEIEFLLFTSTAVDVRALRRRCIIGVFLGGSMFWIIRFLADYQLWTPTKIEWYYFDTLLIVSFIAIIDIADIYIQTRVAFVIQRLFKDNEAGRRQYISIIGLLLLLLIAYNIESVIFYVFLAISWYTAPDKSEAMLLISVSLTTVHYSLSIGIMETGRRCLVHSRKSSTLSLNRNSKSDSSHTPRIRLWRSSGTNKKNSVEPYNVRAPQGSMAGPQSTAVCQSTVSES
ncbi:hypothetical protein BC831DRAFT_453506 [Entophlyctis helioformis]|nr:hypothetical protein BC831DRAFT_453506 [Entophlyctis helioformis]